MLKALLAVVVIASGVSLLAQAPPPAAQEPARPIPTAVWAAKPIQTPGYTGIQKPWNKLADVKARHKGQPNWNDLVVDDGRLHPDTREWFAVLEGQVRVEIEGQPPFTAMRGSIVNIPRQTIYTIETIGDTPSLRFAVNVAHAKTLYQQDVFQPAAPPGTVWIPATINRTPGRYDEFNKPTVNIHEEAAKNEKYAGGRFVRDDKSEMLILYGHEKNLPPLDPADKGHFHAESAEFWLVFSGQIRYAFEGQQPFIAGEGDVVYVPANTWHATRYIGSNSCRLSITEYVGNALILEPRKPGQ